MNALFVRLDAEIVKIREELERVTQSHAKSENTQRQAPNFYDEWAHKASIANGLHCVYTKIESILEDVAAAFEGELPKGDAYNMKLLAQMTLQMPGKRPPLLSEATREVLDNLRAFRHVARVHYPFDLKMPLVLKNLKAAPEAISSFVADYEKFRDFMLEPSIDNDGGGDSPP